MGRQRARLKPRSADLHGFSSPHPACDTAGFPLVRAEKDLDGRQRLVLEQAPSETASETRSGRPVAGDGVHGDLCQQYSGFIPRAVTWDFPLPTRSWGTPG